MAQVQTEPRATAPGAGQSLLRVKNLKKYFPIRGGLLSREVARVHAVDDVSFDILAGETLGLVGESGCGKSTTGRAIMQLPRPTSGTIRFDGQELTKLKSKQIRELRPKMQMIFQDPISSLNPRRRVGDLVGEGLEIWNLGDKESRRKKVVEVLDAVGIDPDTARDRRPHEFSGGQCQRIGIARALVLKPKIIICDEPVSALDVSIQREIVQLLLELRRTDWITINGAGLLPEYRGTAILYSAMFRSATENP